MNTSPENLGIGGKGIGFYFLIKDATKRHGLESYFLFQDKTNLKLYKATPNATGKVGVAAEKASFPASTGTAKIFNYSVTYSPKTGVIEIKRDGVYIGSYTDPSPIQNGTTVMLMTNKMRARFDDVNVTLYKEEFPPAPPPVAAPTLYHTHTDHLGGSSVVTGGLSVYDSTFGATTAYTGTILQQLDQYPFGEERVNNKTAGSSFDTKKKFTGKELDSETGLYYYGARYYDTAIGRFVSEDPSFLTLSDSRSFTMPQGWNSYSYALNNPVRYTDPDGRFFAEAFNWLRFGIYATNEQIAEKERIALNIEQNPNRPQLISPETSIYISQRNIDEMFSESFNKCALCSSEPTIDAKNTDINALSQNELVANREAIADNGQTGATMMMGTIGGLSEMNTASKTFSSLGKGYKSIRIELSQRGPHYQLKPNKGAEIYKSFQSLGEFIESLPKGLKNNQQLINHASKILEKAGEIK